MKFTFYYSLLGLSIISNFLKNYKTGGKILDLGSGPGFFLDALEGNWEKFALDTSEFSISNMENFWKSLVDYGELIVHVLQQNERLYYDLEAFWSNGVRHNFVPEKSSSPP